LIIELEIGLGDFCGDYGMHNFRKLNIWIDAMALAKGSIY
jgi:hypothetical protein